MTLRTPSVPPLSPRPFLAARVLAAERPAATPLVLAVAFALILAVVLALLWPMLGRRYVYDEVSFAQMGEAIAQTGIPYANVGFMINHKGRIDQQYEYGLWHPPLYLYTLGLTFKLFGVSETTARLLGVATMMLTALFLFLAVRAALSAHPNRDGFALWAVLLYVFNPLTLQSALLLDIDGTVLTVMVMLLVWLYLALRDAGWWSRLAVGVAFAGALWAKMTTPFFFLGAVVVYRALQGRLDRGVAEALTIGSVGVALFLPSWWLVCFMTGMPFEMPFEVLAREFEDAAGYGIRSLRTFDAIAQAAQPALRWIGPFLVLVLAGATIVRGIDHLRFFIAALIGLAARARRHLLPAAAPRRPAPTAPVVSASPPADGVTGGQGVDLFIALAWACLLIYLIKTAGEFPKYHIAAMPALAGAVALFSARVFRRLHPLEVALHPLTMAALVGYFFFEVRSAYINVWTFDFLPPLLSVPALLVLPALAVGVVVARRIGPQLVLLPAIASIAWSLPVVYDQSLSPTSTNYFYGISGGPEIGALAASILRPDEFYLAWKDVAYYLPNKNYVDQDSLWHLLNVDKGRFTGDWFGRPIRVIIIFGRDPFLRQQFYAEFEPLYEVREVIGDFALLTRKPGR
ncbi:MAG: glycosyltransferase family 39 protein [Chloroflexota bacterium]|nr:glycosyltransferase family 39 protein [Dehalococcoidia bacterium]MDW8253048.1 glycosyltransferase family 39 protein [Chloroflexota bacterium]